MEVFTYPMRTWGPELGTERLRGLVGKGLSTKWPEESDSMRSPVVARAQEPGDSDVSALLPVLGYAAALPAPALLTRPAKSAVTQAP